MILSLPADSFRVLFPSSRWLFILCFSNIHHSVHHVRPVLCWLCLLLACLFDTSLLKTGSVTFLFFFSGNLNLPHLLCFHLCFCFFYLWFLFVFLLSCISPEVPKEYIFYLFIFYYSVFNFYARVVGTWWFIKDSWCEVIISIWWNGKNSINEVFFLFTSECQNEILLLKNKHRLFLAVSFNRPSRQQEYTNLDPVDDWFICDRFHGFGRCRILDWCFHEMPRKWPLKVFGEKKVESQ